MNDRTALKVIHAARIQIADRKVRYLLLKQVTEDAFAWFYHEPAEPVDPSKFFYSIEEALRFARHHWRLDSFRTLNCGFRYDLPERDEHGCNALFHQMESSYSTPNGAYFDESVGHLCFVQFASQEARDLSKSIKQSNPPHKPKA